jgi:hypothetical protein
MGSSKRSPGGHAADADRRMEGRPMAESQLRRPAQVAETSEDRYATLRDIFIAATGSEEFTETQEQRITSRYLAAEDSVSETITAMAKDDGLADTFAGFEYTDAE